MSGRKLTRKQKAREQRLHPQPKEDRSKKMQPIDYVNLLLGIAGFVLAVGGLILGAQARPTISLEPPLDPNDVLTTRFIISNDGVLALENVTVQSFLKNFEDARHNKIGTAIGLNFVAPSSEILSGEKKTVAFARIVKSAAQVIHGDVGLIVSFTPAYIPFWKKTRAFKFSVTQQADGKSRLEPEPSEGMEKDFEKELKRTH